MKPTSLTHSLFLVLKGTFFTPVCVRLALVGIVVVKIIALQKHHILSLRTCEYVILHYERHLAGVVKLWVLSEEDYSGLSRWTKCNYNGLYKRKAGGSE